VLDLTADPTNPREVGRFSDFYVHAATGAATGSTRRSSGLATLDVTRPTRSSGIRRFNRAAPRTTRG
jgi:hypothetical protein